MDFEQYVIIRRSSKSFTSALAGGLPAWAHAIGRNSEARLRRLLLRTGKIPFAVAPAKSRDPKVEFRVPDASQLEATTSTGSRQLAAALLSKVRAELTSQQAQIVDTLKRQCPGFAVMRKLVLSFRAILHERKASCTSCVRTVQS